MATYKKIQERVRSQTNRVPKTCWIVHVMADEGLPMRAAPNRMTPMSVKVRARQINGHPSWPHCGISG